MLRCLRMSDHHRGATWSVDEVLKDTELDAIAIADEKPQQISTVILARARRRQLAASNLNHGPDKLLRIPSVFKTFEAHHELAPLGPALKNRARRARTARAAQAPARVIEKRPKRVGKGLHVQPAFDAKWPANSSEFEPLHEAAAYCPRQLIGAACLR